MDGKRKETQRKARVNTQMRLHSGQTRILGRSVFWTGAYFGQERILGRSVFCAVIQSIVRQLKNKFFFHENVIKVDHFLHFHSPGDLRVHGQVD